MNIIEVDISGLSSDPSNVRMHSPQQIEKLKASLRRFGQQIPLLVDLSNCVRVGNARLEAMRQLGWDKCWVIRSELDAVRLTEYSIADNKLHDESSFDQTALSQVLATLSAEDGFDPQAVGYSPDEIAALITDQNELPPDADGKALDDEALAAEVKTIPCPHCGGAVPV